MSPEHAISLNKFISDTGYCSRREADKLIEAGRVQLNDRLAVSGARWKPGDTVVVDGSILKPPKQTDRVILAFHKPVGITATTDENIKGNIISYIGYPKRIFPIGRLDKDSEGLILLTNDGDIVNKILRVGNAHEKEYVVRVNRPIDAAFLRAMSAGVPILDTVTLPCKVRQMGRQTFTIVLKQGLNRQIRRMCAYLGYEVVSLQRIRIMDIRLDKLPVGKWRHLSQVELSDLDHALSASHAAAEHPKTKPSLSSRQPEKKTDRSSEPHKKSTGKLDKKTSKEVLNKSKSSSYKEFKKRGRRG